MSIEEAMELKKNKELEKMVEEMTKKYILEKMKSISLNEIKTEVIKDLTEDNKEKPKKRSIIL